MLPWIQAELKAVLFSCGQTMLLVGGDEKRKRAIRPLVAGDDDTVPCHWTTITKLTDPGVESSTNRNGRNPSANGSRMITLFIFACYKLFCLFVFHFILWVEGDALFVILCFLLKEGEIS